MNRTIWLWPILVFSFSTTSVGNSAESGATKRFIGDGEIADFALEVVDKKATLYLARKPTNVPFSDAKVTFQAEDEDAPLTFTPTTSAGVYQIELSRELPVQGDLILETETETDAITLQDASGKSPAGPSSATDAGNGGHDSLKSRLVMLLLGALLGCGIMGAIIFLLKRRRTSNSALAILVASVGVAALFDSGRQALAHGGHDHGDAPGSEVTDIGSDVSISKKSQFLIGLTTMLAQKESLPEAMVTYGHIVPKPQFDATIIAPQAGIVRTGPEVVLGKTVARGETLAKLDAVNQIRISSPISGQILEINAVTGSRVEAGAKLFHITDTSTVWVDAELFASDLAKIKDVTAAHVSTESGPEGAVAKILNVITPISEETRTAKFFLELKNQENAFRVGSLAKITFSLKSNAPSIAVPVSAVLNRGGEYIVFIQKGPETFEPRPVETQASSRPGTVLITSGVNENERIVVTGNYQLLVKVR